MPPQPPPNLLTIPCELRNVIYLHIFSPDRARSSSSYEYATYDNAKDPIAAALKPDFDHDAPLAKPCAPHELRVLQTCRQIHSEAYLLALSLTGFHVVGEAAHPHYFAARMQLREAKVAAIRHLTLTAKISHLRAMNETWAGLPFGNAALELETLTIVPTRPDASFSAYSQVADLSQGHTLAYIFTETFKTLRNVKLVCVKNQGCFNEGVWRLVYRSLVYRIWRWGGGKCGLRFECCDEDEERGAEWFRVYLQEGEEGSEVGDEVVRLVGGSGTLNLPDPTLFNIGSGDT